MAFALLMASATLTWVNGTPLPSSGGKGSLRKVSPEMAGRVAGNYLKKVQPHRLKSATREQSRFTAVAVALENRDTLFYVLNDSVSRSFVIVAADKASRPVLGYSRGGLYDPGKVPPALKAWLESRKNEIGRLKRALSPSPPSAEWEALLAETEPQINTSGGAVPGGEDSLYSSHPTPWSAQSLEAIAFTAAAEASGASFPAVGPLVQTTWDQTCYYNASCPADAGGPCGHAVTGCVATAMAQVMKYWNYPATGTGSNSYIHPTYGTLSADFGSTVYRWNDMPVSLSSDNTAVATLLYHCGVAVHMYYGASSSAAILSPDALVTNFGYSPDGRYVFREDYSDTEWTALMKSELNSLRPVLYRGSGPAGGHAFILDGFEGDDYFHINWGWGGYYDGYFYLGSIDFSEDQGAVTGVYPAGLPGGTPGIHVTPQALTLSGLATSDTVTLTATVDWSATTDQPWLTVYPASGSAGVTPLVVSAPDNNTGTLRTATVTIAASGHSSQVITVEQQKKTAVTAGNLKNLLAGELGTITHLTLTGTIDARDFKTMRDEMPQLQSLDLRGVTIVAYSGTEGTGGSYNVNYPANAIPTMAFSNLYDLSSVELPPSLSAIGSYAFRNCTGMGSLRIPATVTSIGWYAFISSSTMIDVDPANTAYSSHEGLLYNKAGSLLIFCPQSKTGTLTLPGTVTDIEINALSYCTQLDTIIIPPSVTYIGEDAFFINSGYIVVDPANTFFTSLDGVLYDKTLYRLLHCPLTKRGSYSIPEGVHIIMPWAFASCYYLTEITIPSTVTGIGDYAFYYCTNLEAIHTLSEVPLDLSSSEGVFYGVDTGTCLLYVPTGSLAAYRAAVQWQDFTNIVEEEILTAECDLTTSLTATPGIMNGKTNFSLLVKVTEISGTDSQGEITLVIPRDSRWMFFWSTTMTEIAGQEVDNSVWSYDGTNPNNHIFRTAASIAGNSFRAFGIEAVFDPGSTKGISTITTQIIPGSGSDSRASNNSDSEVVNYFGGN